MNFFFMVFSFVFNVLFPSSVLDQNTETIIADKMPEVNAFTRKPYSDKPPEERGGYVNHNLPDEDPLTILTFMRHIKQCVQYFFLCAKCAIYPLPRPINSSSGSTP